jgi:dihydroxy-acid dehydratase
MPAPLRRQSQPALVATQGDAMDERLGATYGACVGHVAPEVFVGGPIGLVEHGDPISIDVAARRLDLEVGPAELDRRRQARKPPQPRYVRGALAKYAALVGGADQGAVCG